VLIREELEKVSGIKLSKCTGLSDFVKKVDKVMTNKDFEALSEVTQDWLNAGVETLDGDDPVTPFPDEEPEENTEAENFEEEDNVKPVKAIKADKAKGKKKVEPKPEEEKEEGPVAKKVKAKSVEKAPAPVVKKKAAAKEGTDEKPVVASNRIVQLAVEFPTETYEELKERIDSEGLELNIVTIRTKAYIAREAYNYLKSIKRLK
jgi:hypothetical protein